MRRWRNIAMATALLVTVIYFVAQQHDELLTIHPLGQQVANFESTSGSTVPQDEDAPNTAPNPPASLAKGEIVQKEVPLSFPNTNDEANLPPSDNPDAPLPTEAAQVGSQAEFNFQKDLDLELPVDALKVYGNNQPHNYNPSGPKTNVYATLMTTRNPSIKDPYYLAIHSLIYRILWSSRSRTEKYAFVVFVRDFVTPEQRQLLAGAGAIVRDIAPLEWDPKVEGIQNRWKDLFTKLNMWKETEFSKVVFLDADAFPVANIDAMFDLAPEQKCIEAKLTLDDYLVDGTSTCEPYVFAGIPQDPFNKESISINGGTLVFSPSTLMYQRFLQNYLKFDKYDVQLVEQAFLNWQFNPNGAFPATALGREFGATFPQEDDEGKFKVVHEKLWSEEREWMKREWVEQWISMTQYYMSEEFQKIRGSDGVAT